MLQSDITFYTVSNYIGFLINSGYRQFGDFVNVADNKKKSELRKWLSVEIRMMLNLSPEQLDELRYDNSNHYRKLRNVLLLFNVETLTRARQRFPFAEHTNEHWSLEHIHSQQSQGMNTEKQWETWLTVQQEALRALPDAAITSARESERKAVLNDIAAALKRMNDGETFGRDAFEDLHARTVKFFDSGEPDHSIRNLALISSRDNSDLSNAVFEAKRQIILKLDRQGSYLPICTKHVFLKYYAATGREQLHFWGDDDKKGYFAAIISETSGIGMFLKQDLLNHEAA